MLSIHLHLSPTATDVARNVVCLTVCWAHRYAVQKMAEPIEMPFGSLTFVGQKNHVLDEGQDRTNQPRGETSRRCGLLPYYFEHLLSSSYFCYLACLFGCHK